MQQGERSRKRAARSRQFRVRNFDFTDDAEEVVSSELKEIFAVEEGSDSDAQQQTTTNNTKPEQTKQEMSVHEEKRPVASSNWDAFVPKACDKDSEIPAGDASLMWKAIYAKVSKNTDEVKQKNIRCGVYLYCCLNGTSREGGYAGKIQCADGTEFLASVVPAVVGLSNVRKFMRANDAESYDFLKNSKALSQHGQKFIQAKANLGISTDLAFACADWFSDSPSLNPAEMRAHNMSQAYGFEKARRARDGKKLEDVEAGRVKDAMHAQGAFTPYANEATVDF